MADIVTAVLTTLLWIFIVGLIGVVGLFFYLQSKYKIQVAYKDFTNGGRWVFDKAKTKKDVLDDTTKWKLQKAKRLIVPTAATTYNNQKGQPVAFFYRYDDDTFIPIKDDTTVESITKNEEFMKTFDPFPTEQKAIFIQQARKNERWKKKGLSDMLLQAFPYVAIILLVAVNLIFLPDVLEGKAVASKEATEAGNAWKEAANAWDEMKNDKSTIGANDKGPNNNGGAPPY